MYHKKQKRSPNKQFGAITNQHGGVHQGQDVHLGEHIKPFDRRPVHSLNLGPQSSEGLLSVLALHQVGIICNAIMGGGSPKPTTPIECILKLLT